MEFPIGLLLVLALVLAAEFVNGWTDAPNAIATVVSTRVLSPALAVLMAAALNFVGAFYGTAVAATIGKDIVRPEAIDLATVGAAMFAIILWSTVAWRFGLPTSESHALVSGLAGAALATAGWDALLWEGWRKVLVGLLFSTFLGFGTRVAPGRRNPVARPAVAPRGREAPVRQTPGPLGRLHGLQPRQQ